jgi:acetoacetyl-CoA reductase
MTSRVALVTGGTGGIGTAICKRLADMGHKVATNYRNEEKATRLAGADEGGRLRHRHRQGRRDLAGQEAEAMVREVEATLGPVDILINNAGITRDGTFHKMKADQWGDVINTNLNSVFNVTRPVIDGMRDRKWGRIIQISRSTASRASTARPTTPRPRPACTASPSRWRARTPSSASP